MIKNKNAKVAVKPSVSKAILKLSTLSLSMMCLSLAHAEDTERPEQPVKVAKVTVTGSSIKGVAAQSTSPITIIKGEDLTNQGITTVEEALPKSVPTKRAFRPHRTWVQVIPKVHLPTCVP